MPAQHRPLTKIPYTIVYPVAHSEDADGHLYTTSSDPSTSNDEEQREVVQDVALLHWHLAPLLIEVRSNATDSPFVIPKSLAAAQRSPPANEQASGDAGHMYDPLLNSRSLDSALHLSSSTTPGPTLPLVARIYTYQYLWCPVNGFPSCFNGEEEQ